MSADVLFRRADGRFAMCGDSGSSPSDRISAALVGVVNLTDRRMMDLSIMRADARFSEQRLAPAKRIAGATFGAALSPVGLFASCRPRRTRRLFTR